MLEKYGIDVSSYEIEQNQRQAQKDMEAFPERAAMIVALSRLDDARRSRAQSSSSVSESRFADQAIRYVQGALERSDQQRQ